jgi:O-Antigen ligase
VQFETDYVAAREIVAKPQAPKGAASRAERALFWTLIATLGVMPSAFGSTRLWASGLAAISIGLTILGYGLCLGFVQGFRMAVPWQRLWRPALMLALAAAWGVTQALPLGTSSLAHPLWSAAGTTLSTAPSGRISVDPYDTATGLMRLGAYTAVFFLAVQLCRDQHRAFLALKALVAIAAVYAIYGVFAYLLTPDHTLAMARASFRGDLSSTFGGRNHYAAYAGLGLLTGLALLAKLVQRPALASPTRRALLANLQQVMVQKAWVPLAASAVLVAAMILTHSHTGLLSTGIGSLALLFCLLTVSRLNRLGRAAVALLVVAGMLLIVNLSGEITLSRLEGGIQSESRLAGLRSVLAGVADAPLLGHGYGAFEPAFQPYATGAQDGRHPGIRNAYLELAFDLGVPAALLLTLSVVAIGTTCFIGVYRRRRDIVYPSLSVAAMVLVGADGLADFSLQVPAVAATFAFILGVGYSQSWSSSDTG